jgi:hypothetical protein
VARPASWTYTLAEAKRQALVAIDFYNRPGDRASFYDFVVHMHLAWQNLLHANFMQQKTDIFFRDLGGRRFARNPDGSKKTWDLAKCVREAMPSGSPVRANIEFFIGLRNQIEHRFQSSIMSATDPQTHALVINFETELVSKFGVENSLGSLLHFPLFVQTLTPSNLPPRSLCVGIFLKLPEIILQNSKKSSVLRFPVVRRSHIEYSLRR